MNKKYKFTGETKKHEGITLHQIQALRSFDEVEEGDIGGWLEKEENLSHESNCWVNGNAQVLGNSMVSGNALVYGNARVFGNALVYGNARVFGNAWVTGNARVNENARVFGNAWVYVNARVNENARVCGDIGNSCDNLPEELHTLPESIEEVTIKGVKYKKVTKWERA